MQELVIATTNLGKFQQLSAALRPLDVAVKNLANFEGSADFEIEETGQTVQENARIKATAYTRCLGETVLSMDNGLYLAGLPDERQPGALVKRIYGQGDYPRPSDRELLAYYAGLITALGGNIEGYWEFAICLATPSGQTFETTVVTPRRFVNRPSRHFISGYPLESLQIDPSSGKYIAEMTGEEKTLFWQRLIGEPLCNFVRDTLKSLSP